MEMRSNDICWTPKNPWEFIIANEDSNLYSFDLRKVSNIKKTYKGHVMPTQSLDQEKKGGMIVSGSLDRTIRVHRPKSDFKSVVFSSSRMSRVLCVSFSIEGNYILSGSEDGNLRIWKKPEIQLDSKIHEKTKKKKLFSHQFSRFHEKNFLPKLVFNIKKMKMKLNDINRLKKFRFMENTTPGNISTKTGFKRPIIDLQI
jgi:WD repeat and SOF domain-containing protein 1